MKQVFDASLVLMPEESTELLDVDFHRQGTAKECVLLGAIQ